MSIDQDFSSLESGDVASLWDQQLLSTSELKVLSETLQQYIGTNGEMLAESEFCDLQNMKEWSGNEGGARESGSGGGNGCASPVTSSAPGGGGGGVMDLQPFHEDQSLFFELVQKDSTFMEDSHDLQIFQGQGLVPEFNTLNTNLDHIFDLYHPVETLAAGDWLSTPSFLAFAGRSPGEAGPNLPSYNTNRSPDILGATSVSDKTLTWPSSGSVASQRSQFDFSVQNNLASGTTLVPIQEVGSAAMDQIQVVKTECHREDHEGPASEVSEGEFDAKKKERRRQQNRTAARRCRNRKKETFDIMFKAAQKAKLENVELVKEIVRLREKLKSVVQLVKFHETHCGFQLTTAAISQLRRPVASAAGER